MLPTGFYRPGYPESARYRPRLFSFRSTSTAPGPAGAGDGGGVGEAVEFILARHVAQLSIEHQGRTAVYEFGAHVFQMRRCVACASSVGWGG
jgi:hypothetical protein